MMVIKLVMKLGSETRSKSKACAFAISNTLPSGEGTLSQNKPEIVSLAYRKTSWQWSGTGRGDPSVEEDFRLLFYEFSKC